jgi:hypothetical protein
VRGIAGHIEQAERGAIRKSPQAHKHFCPLLPTAMVFVSYGVVLVQVQVQVQFYISIRASHPPSGFLKYRPALCIPSFGSVIGGVALAGSSIPRYLFCKLLLQPKKLPQLEPPLFLFMLRFMTFNELYALMVQLFSCSTQRSSEWLQRHISRVNCPHHREAISPSPHLHPLRAKPALGDVSTGGRVDLETTASCNSQYHFMATKTGAPQ